MWSQVILLMSKSYELAPHVFQQLHQIIAALVQWPVTDSFSPSVGKCKV